MKIIPIDNTSSVKETKAKKSREVKGQERAVDVEVSAKSSEASSSASEETVDISSAAREIQTASSIVAEVPDIREEKVVEIRDKIERNEYRVSSRDIADKMLEDIIG